MIYPVMFDTKIPFEISYGITTGILVAGAVVALAYIFWLVKYRGPGCKQYPDKPVWVQQLMDRECFVVNLYALMFFGIIYFFAALYIADIIYRLLAFIGIVPLVE